MLLERTCFSGFKGYFIQVQIKSPRISDVGIEEYPALTLLSIKEVPLLSCLRGGKPRGQLYYNLKPSRPCSYLLLLHEARWPYWAAPKPSMSLVQSAVGWIHPIGHVITWPHKTQCLCKKEGGKSGQRTQWTNKEDKWPQLYLGLL